MRSITANWFECKIRYGRVQEDGTECKVTEIYVVDAMTWGEAEKRIMEEVSSFISGAFEIVDIKKAAYKEIFFADSDSADKWYKVKVAFITLDDRTAKEKKQNVLYLINAKSLDGASKSLSDIMSQGMTDFIKSNITETSIMDVYEYSNNDKNDKNNN